MEGTWAITQIDSTYKHVFNVAQNRNSGQYMLAITTAGDSQTGYNDGQNPGAQSAGAVCRVYKSNDYGATWTLLDLNNVTGLDYAAFLTENNNYNATPMSWCAISDDGKYQTFTQGSAADKRQWYSTNYGSTTGTTNEQWIMIEQQSKWSWPATSGTIGKYTQGDTPVMIASDGTSIRWHDPDMANGGGNILITTRDVTNIQGNEFSFDVAGDKNYIYTCTDGYLSQMNSNISATVVTPTTSNTTDNTSFPVHASVGGGIVVDISNEVLFCARYHNSTGGIWRSGDSGSTWTKKTGDINVNAIGMSSNAQYVIAGPIEDTNGNGTFYLSDDSGENWTTHDLSYSGFIYKLDITNDGKRAVASANQRNEYSWGRHYIEDGYFTYIAPLTAAEQYALGKTVAELVALGYQDSDIINAGYSITQLLVEGVVPDWNIDTDANHFDQSYVNGFMDLSGSVVIRNDNKLITNADLSLGGNLVQPQGTTSLVIDDMTLKSRLFMGEDISANSNVYVGGDLSVNGQFSGDFANGIIPLSAIGGDIDISGNANFTDDVSFNGPTVDVSNTLPVNQIEFNDGTTMTKYDDNILSGSFADSNVVFKDSTFVSVICEGAATATTITQSSDYRIKQNVTELNENDTVDALMPIQYNNTMSGNHEFGLLAHELQEIYPDLVNGEKDGDEYQQVYYNGLIGVLVKEVQDLKQRLVVLHP